MSNFGRFRGNGFDDDRPFWEDLDGRDLGILVFVAALVLGLIGLVAFQELWAPENGGPAVINPSGVAQGQRGNSEGFEFDTGGPTGGADRPAPPILESSDPLALTRFAQESLRNGRHRDALAACERVQKLGATPEIRAEALATKAWVYRSKRDLASAARLIDEAMQLDPSHTPLAVVVALDRNDLSGAASLRARMSGLRTDPRVLAWLDAREALGRGQNEQAVEGFRRVSRMASAPHPLFDLDRSLGDVLMHLDRTGPAIDEYQRLLTLRSDNPLARYKLAQAYQRVGNYEDAVTEYERFLSAWKDADLDVVEMIDARQRLRSVSNAVAQARRRSDPTSQPDQMQRAVVKRDPRTVRARVSPHPRQP